MRKIVAAIVCVLVIAAPAIGRSTGVPESSARTSARWNVPIDSRSEDQWVTTRRNRVFTLRSGHVVALDRASGRLVWQSRGVVQSRPALGGDAIYSVIEHGTIVVLDANTGLERGRRAMKPPATAIPTLLSAAFGAVAIYPEGMHARIDGLQGASHPLWTRRIRFDAAARPFSLGGNAIGFLSPMHGDILILDARTGRALAATDGVYGIVGSDGRYVWLGVGGGGLKGLDLFTGKTIAFHNSIVQGAVRVEHGIAVAVVDGRLMRMDLASEASVPLIIDGRWIGGPANGQLFIERGDGVYLQPLAGGRARRIATHVTDSPLVTADRTTGYVSAIDGTVDVVDLRDGSVVARWGTGCRIFEGIARAADTTLVHCDRSATDSRLLAFDSVR